MSGELGETTVRFLDSAPDDESAELKKAFMYPSDNKYPCSEVAHASVISDEPERAISGRAPRSDLRYALLGSQSAPPISTSALKVQRSTLPRDFMYPSVAKLRFAILGPRSVISRKPRAGSRKPISACAPCSKLAASKQVSHNVSSFTGYHPAVAIRRMPKKRISRNIAQDEERCA